MSTNHRERIERVVDKALKEAAMGEPYGFTVSGPGIWPIYGPDGTVQSTSPAWFIVVTIRATGVGQPDIGNGFPVPGILPPDEAFQGTAVGLLERNRRERDQGNAQALQAFAGAPQGPSMKLSDKPS